MPILNLDAGLRQPIEDLIQRGHTGPWVVFCNALAFSPGEYESDLGTVTVLSSFFHMPVDDLSVTTLAAWNQYKADHPDSDW